MTYLAILATMLLIPAHRFLNRERGRGTEDRFLDLPKLAYYGIWGLLLAAAIHALLPSQWLVPLAALVFAAGYWVQNSLSGWGKWFPHNLKDVSEEEERVSFIVDPLTTRLVGYELTWPMDTEKAIRYKSLAFSLRYTLMSIPLYGAWSLAVMSLWPLAAIPALMVVGYIYRNYYDGTDVGAGEAEYATGLYVGFLNACLVVISYYG